MQLALPPSVAAERAMPLPPATAAMEPPPHDPVRPFGVATATPAGKPSVNATPVSGVLLGLVSVKDNADVPPTEMVAGEKPLVRVGADGGPTVRVAMAGAPGAASLDVMGDVILTCGPRVVPVTKAEIAQVAPGGNATKLEALMLLPPGAAVNTKVHGPPVPITGGFLRMTPTGRLSVNATPCSGTALGFVMVKTSVDGPPSEMVAGVKALVKVGGAGAVTVRVAVAGAPGAASIEVIADVVLTLVPGVDAVTLSS